MNISRLCKACCQIAFLKSVGAVLSPTPSAALSNVTVLILNSAAGGRKYFIVMIEFRLLPVFYSGLRHIDDPTCSGKEYKLIASSVVLWLFCIC